MLPELMTVEETLRKVAADGVGGMTGCVCGECGEVAPAGRSRRHVVRRSYANNYWDVECRAAPWRKAFGWFRHQWLLFRWTHDLG